MINWLFFIGHYVHYHYVYSLIALLRSCLLFRTRSCQLRKRLPSDRVSGSVSMTISSDLTDLPSEGSIFCVLCVRGRVVCAFIYR